ncbi:hypothetical protein [Sphaerospermopsis sp. FACHB-1194]|uniref:hypothetical protein n=1 Tax=Sphaerospermopsis sp. FACHB-1194 TaxID=2692862 RepID=UPI0016806F97|nr:hypothetical protein [Sphaerospermopsis sp. FACHB-1194]MBD2143922.1 hypothetical protein [Sphaerospermopsis sp. FACHB-1194]
MSKRDNNSAVAGTWISNSRSEIMLSVIKICIPIKNIGGRRQKAENIKFILITNYPLPITNYQVSAECN